MPNVLLIDLAAWILFGFLSGTIVHIIITPIFRRELTLATLVSLFGGLLGGFLVELLTGIAKNGFNFTSIIAAIILAAFLQFIFSSYFILTAD